MSANVTFTLGNLPVGYCWSSPQQYAIDLVSILSGVISGNFSGIIIGPNLPAPADQDKAWLRTNVDGTPTRLYVYLGGWLSLHPVPANAQSLLIWKGTEAALWSYDGGDGNDPSITPPTSTTGAMWMRDTDFDFKTIMGIGTNGTTYDGQPATVINPGDTGGAEKVALLYKEMPSHTHTVPLYAGDATNHANRINTTDELTVQDLTYQSGAAGGDTGDAHTWSHNNLPPYRGVILAKRTSRVYYTTS